MLFGTFFLFSGIYLATYFSIFAISLHYAVDFIYYKSIYHTCDIDNHLNDQPLFWVIYGLSQFVLQSSLILVYLYLIDY